MSESRKALVQFGIIACCFIAFFAWFLFDNSVSAWLFRIVPLVIAIFLVILLIRYYRSKDLAPDFLRRDYGIYFERDGFCFALGTFFKEGDMFISVAFQNRYDRRSVVKMALKLFSGFLEKDSLFQKTLNIECPPAAYGIVNFPCIVPEKFQGKRARIEVGAETSYPDGKGKMLRFRDGMHVGIMSLTTAFTPVKKNYVDSLLNPLFFN